jgi:hypothetical protein
MTSETPRFWPQNPGRQPAGPQPESILRKAAAELGPLTDHEVVAELRTRVSGEWLEHDFYLLSSAVGYRYLLFRAHHRLGYPVEIRDAPSEKGTSSDEDPFDEEYEVLECANAEELERALKQIFEHPATQAIVGQLRSLSRETG